MASALVGFVGGGAWEIVEIIADFAFPVFIYNSPLETAIDMAFGTVGGAGEAWRTNAVYTTPRPPVFGIGEGCEESVPSELVSGGERLTVGLSA